MTASARTDSEARRAGQYSGPILNVENLTKEYPGAQGPFRAIDGLTFTVSDGEFVSIVGPSGCGKTTMLNCIAGLLPLSDGAVSMSGEEITAPPPGMSAVFQDYSRSLFPWHTVLNNVLLPLKGSGKPKAQAIEEAKALLAQVGLRPEVVSKQYPWQLSGGMQQRVAIARALVSRPKVLLMDEPFASVDAQTRIDLEDLILSLWDEWQKSILFVTHDIDEAVYLSDRIIVLSQSPSQVVAELEVPIPRPRNQVSTKQDPIFGQLRADVLKLVMNQNP